MFRTFGAEEGENQRRGLWRDNVTTADTIALDKTEYVDQKGWKFTIQHTKVTSQEEDTFWVELTKISDSFVIWAVMHIV